MMDILLERTSNAVEQIFPHKKSSIIFKEKKLYLQVLNLLTTTEFLCFYIYSMDSSPKGLLYLLFKTSYLIQLISVFQ